MLNRGSKPSKRAQLRLAKNQEIDQAVEDDVKNIPPNEQQILLLKEILKELKKLNARSE